MLDLADRRTRRPVIRLADQLRSDLRRDLNLARTADQAGDCIAARQIVLQRIESTRAALTQIGEDA